MEEVEVEVAGIVRRAAVVGADDRIVALPTLVPSLAVRGRRGARAPRMMATLLWEIRRTSVCPELEERERERERAFEDAELPLFFPRRVFSGARRNLDLLKNSFIFSLRERALSLFFSLSSLFLFFQVLSSSSRAPVDTFTVFVTKNKKRRRKQTKQKRLSFSSFLFFFLLLLRRRSCRHRDDFSAT